MFKLLNGILFISYHTYEWFCEQVITITSLSLNVEKYKYLHIEQFKPMTATQDAQWYTYITIHATEPSINLYAWGLHAWDEKFVQTKNQAKPKIFWPKPTTPPFV